MLEDKLLKYVASGIRKINVISPMNSDGLELASVLEWCIKNRKKVLYIIDNTDRASELFRRMGIDIDNECINISTYNEAVYMAETFDVVIYNELCSRPTNSKGAISKSLDALCNSYGTIITYSFEKVYDNEKTVYKFSGTKELPILEPRVITTRVNLEDEVSNYVYDYIKWSINTNKKVLIYVPDDDRVDKVFKTLSKVKSDLKATIYKEKLNGNRNQISKFIVSSAGVLVTDNFHESFKGLHGTNVMLFFADDASIGYRDLVYISSKGDEFSKHKSNEVIFICRRETEEIDKCRKVLRELNKKAWEQGLLKI